MTRPLLAVPILLLPLFACLQDPTNEVAAGAMESLSTVPAQPGELVATLLSEPAGGATIAEARAAVCHAILGGGWLRAAPHVQESFLLQCSSIELRADRKLVSVVNHDQYAIPRVMGWHLHVEFEGMGWDLSLRRGTYGPKKEPWGDPDARNVSLNREVWIADVEASYDAQAARASRDALGPMVGEKLGPLGVSSIPVPPTPSLLIDSSARAAERTDSLGRGPRVAATTRLVQAGRIIGFLVALEEPRVTGEVRGVLLYYDAAAHFVDEAPWEHL